MVRTKANIKNKQRTATVLQERWGYGSCTLHASSLLSIHPKSLWAICQTVLEIRTNIVRRIDGRRDGRRDGRKNGLRTICPPPLFLRGAYNESSTGKTIQIYRKKSHTFIYIYIYIEITYLKGSCQPCCFFSF